MSQRDEGLKEIRNPSLDRRPPVNRKIVPEPERSFFDEDRSKACRVLAIDTLRVEI